MDNVSGLGASSLAGQSNKYGDRVRSSFPATKCIATDNIRIAGCFYGISEISATEFLFSDYPNKRLTLFDIKNDTVLKTLVLESGPWSATTIPGSRIAVTVPELEQIRFFTADHNLNPCDQITVQGKCYGIQYAEDRLVVSFTYPEAHVQIVDLKGTVLQTIQHDPTGTALFEYPQFITLSPDCKLIYASDYSRSTVSCIDTPGNIKWVYQSQELQHPAGLATGDGGCIYVCCLISHAIHVVSSDGARLAIITQRESGVNSPQAVCYSSNSRKLYVSTDCPEGNSIKKLTLK